MEKGSVSLEFFSFFLLKFKLMFLNRDKDSDQLRKVLFHQRHDAIKTPINFMQTIMPHTK